MSESRRSFCRSVGIVATGCVAATAGCSSFTGPELEITQTRAKPGPYGNLHVLGHAKNVSGRDLEYAEVEVTFYNSHDELINSSLDNVNGLRADDTWRFHAPYPGPYPERVDTYDVQPGEVHL